MSECYVAFLDILGFKKIINEESDLPEQAFHIIRSTRDKLEAESNTADLDDEWAEMLENMLIRIMSDSIIIAIQQQYRDSLAFVIYAAGELQRELFKKGILIRGGISCGELYWDDEIVYGRGLVQAYELENCACFPRIIISGNTIRNYLKKERTHGVIYPTDFLFRDSDAWFFCRSFLNERTCDIFSWVNSMLEKEDITGSIREKYVWLQNWLKKSEEYDVSEVELYFSDELVLSK